MTAKLAHRRLGLALFIATLSTPLLAAQDASLNWPEYRGPGGNGLSTNTGLPLHWSEQSNVVWKTAIHGRAWSSPVVWNQQVWITTATEDGHELFVVAVDRETGKIIHDRRLFEIEKPQFAHRFNTYASPTPVVESNRVYVTFGSPGTACLDTRTGQTLWERRDFECNHYRGAGSSPILFRDLLIMNFDGSDHQFVVALDKQTGRTAWKTLRSIDFKDLGPDGKPELEGDLRKAFSTCHVAQLRGRPTLLSQGAKALYAYDPLTGTEWWRVEERTAHSASTRPTAGDDLVFAPTGWSRGTVLAIHPGRTGEIIDANAELPPATELKIAWKSIRNVPKKPSLLHHQGLLFGIDDNGIATCWEAKTGETLWNERIGGNYSASPIAVEHRIYFFSEEGKGTVIGASREFRKLAENQLDDGFMASPAISGKSLILRTRTHLYRIEAAR